MDDQDPRAPTIISVRNIAARSGQTVDEVIASLSILITKGAIHAELLDAPRTAPDGTVTTEIVLMVHDDPRALVERIVNPGNQTAGSEAGAG